MTCSYHFSLAVILRVVEIANSVQVRGDVAPVSILFKQKVAIVVVELVVFSVALSDDIVKLVHLPFIVVLLEGSMVIVARLNSAGVDIRVAAIRSTALDGFVLEHDDFVIACAFGERACTEAFTFLVWTYPRLASASVLTLL